MPGRSWPLTTLVDACNRADVQLSFAITIVMSDSGAGLPSEATISQKLRDVVIAIHKSGKNDELTLKRVRARAENELSLPDGFLKTDSKWKAQSKDIVGSAVVSIVASIKTECMLTWLRTSTARRLRQSPRQNLH